MEYRTLPCSGEKISVLGLGAGSLHNASASEIEETVSLAIDKGINYFDFIPSTAAPLPAIAKGIGRRRNEVFLQVHIGAEYTSGNYGWTTNVDLAKREFEARLELLGTDYADFGFIHCIDEDSDFDAVINGGIWDYACEMKRQGVIKHLAFSTHTVGIARRFLETGEMDLGMFSINPMYDYTDSSSYGKGAANERRALYQEFEKRGVAISVMKAFAGGQLLDARLSPFGRALTKPQCIQYALDKPGVVTVLPGVRGKQDLLELLEALDTTPEEKDYSELASLAPQSIEGSCVYCNHCQPCPNGLEIGLINKYYDLACLGDELAADHYRNLDHVASECSSCGHCDERCPFGVEQSARMQEIAAYFGE